MVKRYPDYDLSSRNTFRMRVRCALYVEVTEEADLEALDWNALPQPVMVMGGGSNLLFTKDFPGTVLHYGETVALDLVQGMFGLGPIPGGGPSPADMASRGLEGTVGGPGPGGKSGLSPNCDWTKSTEDGIVFVTIPAGVVFDDFCAWAAEEGLWGPENLSLIPGEVGASAVQNIGAYGVEAKDIIAEIRAWDRMEGRFVTIDPADCAYGYRTSKFKTKWKGRYVITAVTYRLSCTPKPKLDYGGVRKALEARGMDLVQPQSGPGPISGAGLSPADMASKGLEGTVGGLGPGCKNGLSPKIGRTRSSAGISPETGTSISTDTTPGITLTPQLIRDTIIGIRNQKLPDPQEIGSAGSFFCNPVISKEHFQQIVKIAQEDNGPGYQVPHYDTPDGVKVPAAWMIDQCGFKGAVNGGAQVYPKQPLVIVNASGSAAPEEIIGLEQRVIDAIAAKYGITLHPEVEHV